MNHVRLDRWRHSRHVWNLGHEVKTIKECWMCSFWKDFPLPVLFKCFLSPDFLRRHVSRPWWQGKVSDLFPISSGWLCLGAGSSHVHQQHGVADGGRALSGHRDVLSGKVPRPNIVKVCQNLFVCFVCFVCLKSVFVRHIFPCSIRTARSILW
jgi:hypothetical protein